VVPGHRVARRFCLNSFSRSSLATDFPLGSVVEVALFDFMCREVGLYKLTKEGIITGEPLLLDIIDFDWEWIEAP